MNNRMRPRNSIYLHPPSPKSSSPRQKASNSPKGLQSRLMRVVSPFDRITSFYSIGNSSLPSFLSIQKLTKNELLKNAFLTKVETADTSMVNMSSANKYIRQLPIIENITGKGNDYDDLMNYIFDSNLLPDQILLRIGKIELSRKDLRSLRIGKLLPINLIDACLSCIKKKNKKMFHKKDSHERVIIVKTSFAQKVLQSKEKVSIRSKKNLLNFE